MILVPSLRRPRQPSDWLDRMRSVHVAVAAQALGLRVQRAHGASGGAFPCPTCGAETRHASRGDRRYAAGVRSDGRGWRCFECDVSGDVLDLVAFVLCDRRFRGLAAAEFTKVREWCTRHLGGVDSVPVRAHSSPSLNRSTASRGYPPLDEVTDLWNLCTAVADDPHVSEYLKARKIDPTALSPRVARALPTNVSLPAWAGVSSYVWNARGYRLVLPLFDERGCLRSLLARAIDPETRPKSVAARGFERRGLAMADDFAAQMLDAGVLPEHWNGRIVVAEGEIDFLSWITERRAAGEPFPMVLGITSGAWTQALADRLPTNAVVVVATDPDEQGEKYFGVVHSTLAARQRRGEIEVERWRAA